MKKYLIVPGRVVSRNDGDIHYISAGKLMRLYGVDPKECVARSEEDYRRMGTRGLPEGIKVLGPRNDGRYDIDEL